MPDAPGSPIRDRDCWYGTQNPERRRPTSPATRSSENRSRSGACVMSGRFSSNQWSRAAFHAARGSSSQRKGSSSIWFQNASTPSRFAFCARRTTHVAGRLRCLPSSLTRSKVVGGKSRLRSRAASRRRHPGSSGAFCNWSRAPRKAAGLSLLLHSIARASSHSLRGASPSGKTVQRSGLPRNQPWARLEFVLREGKA